MEPRHGRSAAIGIGVHREAFLEALDGVIRVDPDMGNEISPAPDRLPTTTASADTSTTVTAPSSG